MNSRLTLNYEFSRAGDDFGWLAADLASPDFSVRNGTWVQWQDVADFAAALARDPLASEATADWGFSEEGRHRSIIRILPAPLETKGGLRVSVLLANYYEPVDCTSVRLDTDQASVAAFAEGLRAMMAREAESACLVGDRPADR